MSDKKIKSFLQLISVEDAHSCFPRFPHVTKNINAYWQIICTCLDKKQLPRTKEFMGYVIGTLRAENESLSCAVEKPSSLNSRRLPFDRYEFREDLGNIDPGDGEKFKGRGFGQLTGKANYFRIGKKIGLPLVAHPELAAAPQAAAEVFAEFLFSIQDQVMVFLTIKPENYLQQARKLYNGGTNGMTRFLEGYNVTQKVIERKQARMERGAGS